MYVSRGKGGIIYDLDDKPFVDMSCAHGAGLLGNGHPAIDRAMAKAMEIGYVNALETVHHEELARKLTEVIPCADMVRFVNSGSEATMHLIRLCRSVTGKKKIIRMEGHFHGYHDAIYIGGQPPEEFFADNRTNPYVESPGIPGELAHFIIPVPFNDIDAFDQAVKEHGAETAMVILEPINFNTGGIKPLPGYLEHLREVTQKENIILFFDEIQTSFKTCVGGAQEFFGVTPDVCTIGKSVGGGLPLSIMCGRKDIMQEFKPVGKTQHSGTFNAHLISILAGLAFMEEVKKPEFYPTLERLGAQLYTGIDRIIAAHDLNMVVPSHGPRFNIVFGRKTAPIRYEDTFTHKAQTMFYFLCETFRHGVYYHDYSGSPAHHGYSVLHTKDDIDKVLNVTEDVLVRMKKLEMI